MSKEEPFLIISQGTADALIAKANKLHEHHFQLKEQSLQRLQQATKDLERAEEQLFLLDQRIGRLSYAIHISGYVAPLALHQHNPDSQLTVEQDGVVTAFNNKGHLVSAILD
ncbi:hypothetical protein BJ165DRAFT_1525752 [Panaeolus papilionaceus]|nr:hypothetical protein BJ165DRAFT_1525752 [Panaeolus papilionaceus]